MTVLRFKTTEQSIDETTQAQQVRRSGYELMAGPRLSGGIAGHRVRPLDRNQTTAAVRTKKEEKQGSALSANLLQNSKRLALKWMRFARDPDGGRKLAEVGSVSGSPSMRSTTRPWWDGCEVESRTSAS